VVEYERRAFRSLRRVGLADQRRIVARIELLADEPRPPRAEKLAGLGDAWRVRQGDYRIVYTIDDSERVVTITRIGHRREVYRAP
jgi:mRNA interferase RelE/StbE